MKQENTLLYVLIFLFALLVLLKGAEMFSEEDMISACKTALVGSVINVQPVSAETEQEEEALDTQEEEEALDTQEEEEVIYQYESHTGKKISGNQANMDHVDNQFKKNNQIDDVLSYCQQKCNDAGNGKT